MRRALGALAASAALAAAAPALAAECPKTTLGDVEDEVMCPVCGTPLALATEAPQAERERELIRRLVDDCRSKDDVKEVLAAEFGDEVLAMPEGEGFELAAYLVPGGAIMVAGVAIGAAALRWRRARGGPPSYAPPADDGKGPRRADEGDPAEAPSPGAAAAKRLETDLERYDL